MSRLLRLRLQLNARTNHRVRMFLTCEQLWSCSPGRRRISHSTWILRICKYLVSFPDTARAGVVKEQQPEKPACSGPHLGSLKKSEFGVRPCEFSGSLNWLRKTWETQMGLGVSLSDHLLCLPNFPHFIRPLHSSVFRLTMTPASTNLIAAVKVHSWSRRLTRELSSLMIRSSGALADWPASLLVGSTPSPLPSGSSEVLPT